MSTTKAEDFVRALVEPFQPVEDAFQGLEVGHRVDDAVGAQLTDLGKLVGRPRDGVTDDDVFRRYVRAQIVTNGSDGLIEDLISVADLVVYDDDATYTIVNQGAACVVLRIEGIVLTSDLAELLLTFLRRAVAGGVRIILEYYSSTIADVLIWGDGTWGQNWAAGSE